MARKKKTTTLSASQTLATPINSTIDSFLIGGKGPFYIDLPTDATPTITSLNVTNTITSSSAIISYIESYSAEITNLKSASFGTTTLTADEITTDTIIINTSNGLSGDNLTVSNLYSSSTTNQVYCSTGNTSSSGSWKSLSISIYGYTSTNIFAPTGSGSYTFRMTSTPSITPICEVSDNYFICFSSSGFTISGSHTFPKTFYLTGSNVVGYFTIHNTSYAVGFCWGKGSISSGVNYTCYPATPSTTTLSYPSSWTINFS